MNTHDIVSMHASYYMKVRLLDKKKSRCFCFAKSREEALALLRKAAMRKKVAGFIIEKEKITRTPL